MKCHLLWCFSILGSSVKGTVTLFHLHSSPSVSLRVIGVNSGEITSSDVILSVCLLHDKHSSLHHNTMTADKIMAQSLSNSSMKHHVIFSVLYLQVGMIFYNFSFDSANADVLASHPLCLK